MRASNIIAILVIALSLPVFILARGNIINNPKPQVETIDNYPSPKYAKVFFLGYNAMAATFLFTKAQYYYGSHYITDKNFPLIEMMIKVIIELNPTLKFMIFLGEASLASMGTAESLEAANRLLDLGHKLYPEDYEFVFNKGFNYYFFMKDMKKAYPLMYEGARMKGAPEKLYWMTSRLATYTGEYRLTYEYTKEMMAKSKDPNMKKYFEERLQLFGELIFLSDKVLEYRNLTGEYPDRAMKSLVSKGLIAEIPRDPFNGEYFYDKDENIVKTSSIGVYGFKRNEKQGGENGH